VTKIVITAAGKGTRLLPFTKEMPKEMIPIFSDSSKKYRKVIPLLQYIYEQLYEMNFRDYCFIIRKEKKAIEEHFKIKNESLDDLPKNYKKQMETFFKKIKNSHFTWINQNKPLGFGHAVKQAEKFVGNEDFIVHAGDAVILSKYKHPILRLKEVSKKNPDAKAILLCKKVKDSKRYGVPSVKKLSNNLYLVKEVEEKPSKPKSKLGIMPLYYFKPEIFTSLKNIKPGKGGEYQLTDAIQDLITKKQKVLTIILEQYEEEIDVGTVETFRHSQEITFRKA
jgi:UTP--glucose-1-phosphate uridylyltransferase|tara:strand:- start:1654 stop:2493 length:840 start_codon:yes stop_codon:yes gene_type:complete